MGILQEMLLLNALTGSGKRRFDDDDPLASYLRIKEFLEKNSKKDEKKEERKRGKYELSILELSFGLALCMYIGGFATFWTVSHLTH